MDKRIVYGIGSGFVILCILVAGVLLASSHSYDSTPRETAESVNITVPAPPVQETHETRVTLAYTIETSPFSDAGLDLMKVEVIDPEEGTVLKAFTGDRLAEVFTPGTGTRVPSVSVRLDLDRETIPETLTHRLTFISKNRAVLPIVVSGGDTPVSPQS